ncbi:MULTISPECIES: heavy-metal-associated domain-containing protein [Acetobacterium]|uniref:heavy-metal-associated domain-containing protein n=1 Tax=Acetobacterium TaxID=33951 RepID=UPI0004075918|nr:MULTISPECIES: heavy-metal-associated domain-containing protein [Acetobacterium]MBU4539669.1 heavy-metal-associated domain-containing protein [Bacillota bacterium]
MVQMTLNIEGLSSGLCGQELMETIIKIDAQAEVAVDLPKKNITIEFDAEVTRLDSFIYSVENEGYSVTDIKLIIFRYGY